jgi:hypothetical protein
MVRLRSKVQSINLRELIEMVTGLGECCLGRRTNTHTFMRVLSTRRIYSMEKVMLRLFRQTQITCWIIRWRFC